MFPGRYVFGLARNLITRDATPIPVHDRDPFSSMEKYVEYGDYPYAIWWCKGVMPDKRGNIRDCERVEISCAFFDEDGEFEDEFEPVFQGIFLPDEGIVETFHYIPDVWLEHLERRSRTSEKT